MKHLSNFIPHLSYLKYLNLLFIYVFKWSFCNSELCKIISVCTVSTFKNGFLLLHLIGPLNLIYKYPFPLFFLFNLVKPNSSYRKKIREVWGERESELCLRENMDFSLEGGLRCDPPFYFLIGAICAMPGETWDHS